jgi:hypothetical protein
MILVATGASKAMSTIMSMAIITPIQGNPKQVIVKGLPDLKAWMDYFASILQELVKN